MALVEQLESQGNWLFRYRGQLPLILFLLVIPVMIYTAPVNLEPSSSNLWTLMAIAISVLGAVVRAYTIGTTPRGTSGRNTKNQVAEQLNTTGIYSTVRHPLYLGNYLMWIGIVIYTFDPVFTISVSLLYWIYYERIMMAEERFLIGKFGDSYYAWADKTPAFFPRLSSFTTPSETFSLRSVFRREYSGWLATVVGFAYVDFLRVLRTDDYAFVSAGNNWWVKWMMILIVFTGITLLLRSLKHYTSLLKEEGRS
ncbi:MAG: isoprenylcysteine carboxylmethyltransferase family protein [Bacteroidia bacterium]